MQGHWVHSPTQEEDMKDAIRKTTKEMQQLPGLSVWDEEEYDRDATAKMWGILEELEKLLRRKNRAATKPSKYIQLQWSLRQGLWRDNKHVDCVGYWYVKVELVDSG